MIVLKLMVCLCRNDYISYKCFVTLKLFGLKMRKYVLTIVNKSNTCILLKAWIVIVYLVIGGMTLVWCNFEYTASQCGEIKIL